MCISLAIIICLYMQHVDREFYIAGTAKHIFLDTVAILFLCLSFYGDTHIWPGTCVSLCFLVVLFWFDVDCHYACDQQCPCIFFYCLFQLEGPSLRA